jgi:ABC-type phosphonate transport system ATPase subunit
VGAAIKDGKPFFLRCGDTYINGESGSGRSTLLNALALETGIDIGVLTYATREGQTRATLELLRGM